MEIVVLMVNSDPISSNMALPELGIFIAIFFVSCPLKMSNEGVRTLSTPQTGGTLGRLGRTWICHNKVVVKKIYVQQAGPQSIF